MLRKFLAEMVLQGFSLRVGSDGETDYVGTDPAKAMEAVGQLDEAVIRFVKDGQVRDWLLYIADLDEDERIADCGADGPVQYLLDTHFPPA